MIGYVYKLVCSETKKVYYGSTINPSKRYNQHCSSLNRCSSRVLIKPEFQILECVVIEDEENFKTQLRLREKDYIKNNDCVNKNIPTRTNKEYYRDKVKENPNYLKELYIRQGGIQRNRRTKRQCACGGSFIQRNKKHHELSKKHLNYVYNNKV